jgi:hypothetical protein
MAVQPQLPARGALEAMRGGQATARPSCRRPPYKKLYSDVAPTDSVRTCGNSVNTAACDMDVGRRETPNAVVNIVLFVPAAQPNQRSCTITATLTTWADCCSATAMYRGCQRLGLSYIYAHVFSRHLQGAVASALPWKEASSFTSMMRT